MRTTRFRSNRSCWAHPQLPATVLRLPMVYGPGDALHRFHPIVKRIGDNRQTIVMSADTAGWRATKGYVENVAAAIALAAVSDRAAGKIYNVGEADALTELEWAGRIAKALGWNGEFAVYRMRCCRRSCARPATRSSTG